MLSPPAAGCRSEPGKPTGSMTRGRRRAGNRFELSRPLPGRTENALVAGESARRAVNNRALGGPELFAIDVKHPQTLYPVEVFAVSRCERQVEPQADARL